MSDTLAGLMTAYFNDRDDIDTKKSEIEALQAEMSELAKTIETFTGGTFTYDSKLWVVRNGVITEEVTPGDYDGTETL